MRRRAIIGKSKGGGAVSTGFKMQIQTTTANEVFTLPTRSGYGYNATVLWGDGTQSNVTGHNINNTKTYTTAGTYNIEIKGTFDAIYFNNTGSKLLVKRILSWGGSDFQGFTAMDYSFYGCTNLNELAVGGVKERTPITNFTYTFNNCSSLISLPATLFQYNTAVTNFGNTFNNCSSLTSLPTDLFMYNTKVTTFSNTFYGCSSLTSLPTDLFMYNTAVTNFNGTFLNCSSLTSLPATLFQYNTAVTNFSNTFYGCSSLTSLPTDLFMYNTKVTTFSNTFLNCSALTSLSTDLFRYNTAATDFSYTFNNCSSLISLPTDLFMYNTAATDFSNTFYGCTKLQLRSDIFGATPNFGTRVMNFTNCFNRTSFTGTQGTAPALWSATMNASSTKTTCFGGAGNSATSLTNYASIPTAWK